MRGTLPPPPLPPPSETQLTKTASRRRSLIALFLAHNSAWSLAFPQLTAPFDLTSRKQARPSSRKEPSLVLPSTSHSARGRRQGSRGKWKGDERRGKGGKGGLGEARGKDHTHSDFLASSSDFFTVPRRDAPRRTLRQRLMSVLLLGVSLFQA